MQVIEIINNSADDNQSELLVCAFIAHEYQLEIINGIHRALIGFSQGVHTVWIDGDDEVVELEDYGNGVVNLDTLTGAMLQAYIKNTQKCFSFGEGHRDLEANAIYRYLNTRMKLSESRMVKVIIHKAGRNGFVQNGELLSSE